MGVASITIEISHPTITAGNAPKLFGQSFKAQGTYPDCSYGGTTVTIYEQRYGEARERQIATVQSGPDGRYELIVRPQVQTTYLARVHGSGWARASVKVHRRIIIEGTLIDEGGYRSGVHGRLLPAEASVPVGITRQEPDGRRTYLNQAVTDSSGRFRLGFNPTEGERRYFVYTSARLGSLRGSTSFTRHLFVTRG